MAGKVPALRRHPYSRKLATLLATVVYLEAKATDDAEWQAVAMAARKPRYMATPWSCSTF